jgi:hypothetical protein
VKDAAHEISKKLSTIFRQDGFEFAAPESYQDTLKNIIASEEISGLDPDGMESLKKSLDSHCVDIQMIGVIVEILKSGLAGDNTEGLERNLMDLCGYFLEVGDFQALNHLHDRLIGGNDSAPGVSYSPIRKILTAFETPEFVNGVLNGLQSWGREKYPDIQKLVQKVGQPFVESALDRLAEEPSRSIRRFYLDLLFKMGAVVRDVALSRLRDKRWYFVRNLTLILGHLDDPSILPAIKKILGHPHPKVREEVFRILSHFRDPAADRIVLADLSCQEKEVQRSAVRLAEDSRSPEVLNKLLELLNRRSVFGADCDLKIHVIRTLAKIGNPESLPHLERLLRRKNFLHRQAMNLLKAEAIISLEFYPSKEAVLFLERVSRDRRLANLASRTRKNYSRGPIHEPGAATKAL